jgi:aryl-alcohol dehydrogenase-like predicted oxidoreductase
LRVSALSLGAMTFGASQTLMKGVTSSDEEARRVFDRALEAGINLVDTANVYTEGRSEELTGEWAAGKRDQLLIATKCRFPLGFGITHKPGPNEWGLSRKAIMTACEGSLRRLKTDVIDLYQVHMQDRNVAIDETLRALDDLVTEGKVRYIGCANYAGYSLVESLWAADRLQTHRYESIQLQWSLAQRSAERELIPAAAAFGLGVLVWSPLARSCARVRQVSRPAHVAGGHRPSAPPPISAARPYAARASAPGRGLQRCGADKIALHVGLSAQDGYHQSPGAGAGAGPQLGQ